VDVIESKKILKSFSSLLFTVTSTNGFYSPLLLSRSGLKLVCNVNIVYGHLKSENFRDYVQKPQRNCTLINSTSAKVSPYITLLEK
jgi:hypothetical protein